MYISRRRLPLYGNVPRRLLQGVQPVLRAHLRRRFTGAKVLADWYKSTNTHAKKLVRRTYVRRPSRFLPQELNFLALLIQKYEY